MNFRKLLLTFIVLFFISCGQKGNKNITQPREAYTFQKKNAQTKKEDTQELKLVKKIDKKCHLKANYKKNNSFIISLNEENNFNKFSDKLLKKSQKKLICVSDVLLQNPKQLYILISGYASESSSQMGNQHLSDDRAITVAELFYKQGVRDEIFARGCADKNPTMQREVKIFIYSDRSTVKSHCK